MLFLFVSTGCTDFFSQSYQKVMNKVASYTDDYLIIEKSSMTCLDQYKFLLNTKVKMQSEIKDDVLKNYRLEGEEILIQELKKYEKNPMGMPESLEEAKLLIKQIESLAPAFFQRCLKKIKLVRKACLSSYSKEDYELWNCIGTGETILMANLIKSSPLYFYFDDDEKKRIEGELALTFVGLPTLNKIIDK